MPVLLFGRSRARLCSAKVFAVIALVIAAIALSIPSRAEEAWWQPDYTEVFGEVELEGTAFFEDPQFDRQRRDDISVALEGTALAEWNEGDTVATFIPFYRFDVQDDARTHADIREMKIEHTQGDWSGTFGVDRVFWGKTEVVRLVDVINQTDQVERIDDEVRLGQPLLRLSRLTDLGEVAVFYLPFARARTLPGPEGRLRGAIPFNLNDPDFDVAGGQWAPSFAVRYTGIFGGLDLGLSAFQGVSRDPAFRLEAGRLVPVYDRITQAGIDAQYTSGATLWKLEALAREGQRNADFETETYGAITGGFEHTLFQVFDTEADLGLIAEAAYDSRGPDALTLFENDVILGTRLTLNDVQDTALLLTASVDVEDGATSFRLEGERRLGAQVFAEIEAQGFLNASDDPLDAGVEDDSFVRLKLTYFF